MDKYVLTEALGSGAFGTVYKGYRRQDNLSVAVKVINSTKFTWNDVINLREGTSIRQPVYICTHLSLCLESQTFRDVCIFESD